MANMVNEDMGKGLHCGRDDCPPCEGGEENKRQNCRLRSILYETSCLLCNPVENKNDKKKERAGVYIGESSRSLSERIGEHVDDARAFKEGSHIVKHWMEKHPSLDRFPPFRYKIRKTFKDCLSRQVNEAVAIFMAEETLLNEKNDKIAPSCDSYHTI